RILPEMPATGVADPAGTVTVHNPCLSGGALEIFLEPALPAPLVLILGDAPIARAVAGLAERLGYAVMPADAGAIPVDAVALVVASHGHGEAEALTAAVRSRVPYIGLVASARRGAAVLAALELTEEGRTLLR